MKMKNACNWNILECLNLSFYEVFIFILEKKIRPFVGFEPTTFCIGWMNASFTFVFLLLRKMRMFAHQETYIGLKATYLSFKKSM